MQQPADNISAAFEVMPLKYKIEKNLVPIQYTKQR